MRRRYVISYDIASDQRRTRVFELLHGFGDHVQFSVFYADLSDQELVVLRTRVRAMIDERLDQVMIIDLGRESRPMEHCLEVLGKPYRPATRTIVV